MKKVPGSFVLSLVLSLWLFLGSGCSEDDKSASARATPSPGVTSSPDATPTPALSCRGISLPVPEAPNPMVARIATGGISSATYAVDSSGLGELTAPANTCGASGSVAERIADCKTQNPDTSEYADTGSGCRYWWSLVTKTATGEAVWRDNLTGLIWSDMIAESANWCQAIGSNNKAGSPLSEDDLNGPCGNNVYQSQTAPESLCVEDATNLNGTTISHAGKGGLGTLSGATTSLTWWLPSLDDLSTAYSHGAERVLPLFRLHWWWSASVHSNFRGSAWFFIGNNGKPFYVSRANPYSVRCVGR